jgi:hypothetical protein
MEARMRSSGASLARTPNPNPSPSVTLRPGAGAGVGEGAGAGAGAGEEAGAGAGAGASASAGAGAVAVDAAETWTLERQLSRPGAVTSCAFSPDGMRLVSVGGGRVGVWDILTNREVRW